MKTSVYHELKKKFAFDKSNHAAGTNKIKIWEENK